MTPLGYSEKAASARLETCFGHMAGRTLLKRWRGPSALDRRLSAESLSPQPKDSTQRIGSFSTKLVFYCEYVPCIAF